MGTLINGTSSVPPGLRKIQDNMKINSRGSNLESKIPINNTVDNVYST